jgi:uncharacterized protein YecE (DUF72 family)
VAKPNDASPARTLVGCCGFATAQRRYFHSYPILEVQRTFYQPPQLATAERWRDDAPASFVFTLKAWQLVSHEASSPTYRRLREPLSERDRSRCGGLRLNDVTRSAWERTLDIADALDGSAIVVQLPKRFRPSKTHLRRARRFFEGVSRRGKRIALELRGAEWTPDTVRSLVSDLDLVHAVDPFVDAPVGRGLRYFRLHGRPAYNYSYRYSDGDLDELETCLSGAWPNWVLFNNDAMADDAQRLLRRLE